MRRSKALFGLLISLTLGNALRAPAQDVPPPPKPGNIFGQENPAAPGQNLPGQDIKEAVTDDFEIQTRGPIHEAYAEVYEANPQPGLLVMKKSPQPIDEVPPNIKPEGQDIVWISGYWAWDDENQDFMWVSGIWRKPPPGLEWVPGYWAEVDGGYRWVSGFWGRPGDDIAYREPPPESRDQQMILDSGANDQFWVPGSWDWQNNQYVWSDGYYAPYQQNWCWVPVRWRWTPRGYIRLAGYWDFRPTVRAMLFAPVVFRPGVLLRPRFVYTPRVVVDPWIALNHFWLRPGYGHYYFGNYYGANYARFGFTPYASYFRVGGHWDPIFSYYQSYYRRQGVDFHARLDSYNNYFTTNANLRPPLNWDAQRRFSDEHRGKDLLSTSIITSQIGAFANSPGARMPLVSIDDRVRTALGQADNRMHKQLLQHRELAELAKRDAGAAGKASDFVSWSLPKLDRDLNGKDLRLAGSKIDSAVRRDLEGRPPPRKVDATPRKNEGIANKNLDSTPSVAPRRDPQAGNVGRSSNAPSKAEMDIIRERFGNDPVRFQQEMDKLWSRRPGEQPSISPRDRPITPDRGSGNSLQGSGRAGSSGSPDFRLLPRSGGGGADAPKADDRRPFSGGASGANSNMGSGRGSGFGNKVGAGEGLAPRANTPILSGNSPVRSPAGSNLGAAKIGAGKMGSSKMSSGDLGGRIGGGSGGLGSSLGNGGAGLRNGGGGGGGRGGRR